MKTFVLGILCIFILSSVAHAAGDSVEIGHVRDLLEIREPIGDVRDTLTAAELNMLQGGRVITRAGATNYNQYLRFSEKTIGSETLWSPVVNYTKNNAPLDTVRDWLYVGEGMGNVSKAFFEYEIEFEDGLESRIISTRLEDIFGEKVDILGETYTFLYTQIDTAADDITLELVTGDLEDTLYEGNSETYFVDGRTYTVEVLNVDSTNRPHTATFRINGETTPPMPVTDTTVLRDGIFFTVSGLNALIDEVTFMLDSTTIRLKDTDYTNSETSNPQLGYNNFVKINGDEIEDAWVQIKGNELSSGVEFEIFSIKYRLLADPLPGYRDVWVNASHGVREFLDEPQGMLAEWDIRYEGLDDTGISLLQVNPIGDDEYRFIFENQQGMVYNVPLITNEGGTFKYGDDNDDFVFEEGTIVTSPPSTAADQNFNIGLLDYFALSNMDVAYDNNAITHIIRYESIDSANQQIHVQDLATGNRRFIYNLNTGINGTLGETQLVFGGNTYTAYIANLTNNHAANNPLAIDMDSDGTIDSAEIRITTQGGGIVDLGNAAASHGGIWNGDNSSTGANNGTWSNQGNTLVTNTVNFTLTTLAEDFDESFPASLHGQGSNINEYTSFIAEKRPNNRIGMDVSMITSNAGLTMHRPDNDDDNYFGMTDYGIYLNVFDLAGIDDAETLTIEYPLTQRGVDVFIVETTIPKLPDLMVTRLNQYPPNPEVGELVTMNLTVTNVGTANASNFTWTYDFDYGQGSGRDFSGFSSGESINLTFDHNYAVGGEHTFYFEIDPNNVVEELNETNNVILHPIFVAGKPDLIPHILHVDTTSPPNVAFTFNIANGGNIFAENILYDIQFGDNTGTGGFIPEKIHPGENNTFTATHTYSRLQQYDITFTVDPQNMIVELNETNNIATQRIHLQPDLLTPLQSPRPCTFNLSTGNTSCP